MIQQKLFTAILFSFISSLSIAKVPRDWIHPESEQFAVWAQPLQQNSPAEFGTELFHFYDLTGDLVAGLSQPNKSKKEKQPWYLQSMGMELGIEAEGAIGLVGLGGEAAIEMVWARTKESVSRLQKKHYPNPGPTQALSIDAEFIQSDLKLSTDMSEQTFENQVDQLMNVLRKTQNLKNPSLLRQALLREVSKLRKWVEGLEVSLPESSWRPYKFQTLIKLTAEGMVQPGLEVGGTIQVKLEWTLRQKQPATALIGTTEKKNADFLRGLSADFEILRPLMSKKEYYTLTNIKLGIGVGVEGDIGIAEGEVEVFGNLFWKEFPKTQTVNSQAFTDSQGFVTLTSGNQTVPRSQWHRGLKKAMQISQFVVKTATAYEKKKAAKVPPEKRDFELKFLEIEFEVVASGSTFLPTLSKMGNADLYFVKQN